MAPWLADLKDALCEAISPSSDVSGNGGLCKPSFRLTVDSADASSIPDGDYELHPEGDKRVLPCREIR